MQRREFHLGYGTYCGMTYLLRWTDLGQLDRSRLVSFLRCLVHPHFIRGHGFRTSPLSVLAITVLVIRLHDSLSVCENIAWILMLVLQSRAPRHCCMEARSAVLW